jgi:hypothetical protein
MRIQFALYYAILVLSLAILLASPTASSSARAAGPWYVAAGGNDANAVTKPAGPAQDEFTYIDSGLPVLETSAGAWGDYDNDGDLDILLTGYLNEPWSGGDKVRIYRNTGNGSFVDTYSLPDLFLSPSAMWGDYNNDGWLDLVISYEYNDIHSTQLYHNNGNGTLSAKDVGMYGVQGQPAWGDYDNDGRLDLLVGTRLYHNNGGGTFSQINVGLPMAVAGTSAWGDYDNDGRLDLLIGPHLYHNGGNAVFSEINAGLPTMMSGLTAWGDFDNDGWLDILLAGPLSDYERIARIYHNNGNGAFTDANADLPGITAGSAAWGDYDNDGDLDIGLLGSTEQFGDITRVYRNDGNGTFIDIEAGLPGQRGASIVWGDYDNDGRLDVLLTSGSIYRNNATNANTPPAAPSDLAAVMEGLTVHLTWSAASDAQTPASGLTYNLRVGARPGSADVVVPTANTITGWRRLPQMGNVQTGLDATLVNLKPGRYYWSVQAVDTAFAGGAFAEESSFVVPGCYLPLVMKGQ